MVIRHPEEAKVEGSLWEPGRRVGLIAVGPEQRPPYGVFYLLTLRLLWNRRLWNRWGSWFQGLGHGW